ncbi:hypothetical protein SteCoe_26246 [Stentor coeruleus]|uniref:Uncharacterized protein n=1 Tax=Stentor coeruleus TaxID=5963 RepID=A0A1R2BDE9_9CILI|nr:hypothetical protein SteCoe_26246 [Stentor coeruleus]
MSSDHKTLISSVQIHKIQKTHARPLSATSYYTAKESNWLIQYHQASEPKFSSKIFTSQPYTLQPKNLQVIIRPKFAQNVKNTCNNLIKASSLDTIPERQPFGLSKSPKISHSLEKSLSLSRLAIPRSECILNNFKRPTTVLNRPLIALSKSFKPVVEETSPINSYRELWSEREDNDEAEILPEKGREFVREVRKIWEFMDKGIENHNFKEESSEEEELKIKNADVLNLHMLDYEHRNEKVIENTHNSIIEEKEVSIFKKKNMMKGQHLLALGIKAQPKILTERKIVKKKPLLRSNIFKQFAKDIRK